MNLINLLVHFSFCHPHPPPPPPPLPPLSSSLAGVERGATSAAWRSGAALALPLSLCNILCRYHSQGCTTLSYTAPFSIFFYASGGCCLRQLAAAALAEAGAGQVRRRPVFQPNSSSNSHVHSPSSASSCTCSATRAPSPFAALLATCPSLRPAAVVWDSAPAWSPALEPALLNSATLPLRVDADPAVFSPAADLFSIHSAAHAASSPAVAPSAV